jgi:hypothetical protein
MELLFRALGVMIPDPWLALVPGVLLLALYARARRLSALLLGLAWPAYGLYEYAMKLRILCSGECNIRIDLLAIYPVLVAGSVLAVVRSLAALRAGRARS